MTKFWVWPVTRENWEILNTKHLWATDHDVATSKVSNGDRIIFYVMGEKVFAVIFEVDGEWYASEQLLWADEVREATKYWHSEVRLRPIKADEAPPRTIQRETGVHQ